MEKTTIFWTLATLLSWGVGSFFSKLAADKIGVKGALFEFIPYFFGVLIYSLFLFPLKEFLTADKIGILWAFLGGLLSSLGMIGFYTLLSKGDVSATAPLTALYPAVTAILGFLILHESVTLPKILGIIFSLMAIYFLSK